MCSIFLGGRTAATECVDSPRCSVGTPARGFPRESAIRTCPLACLGLAIRAGRARISAKEGRVLLTIGNEGMQGPQLLACLEVWTRGPSRKCSRISSGASLQSSFTAAWLLLSGTSQGFGLPVVLQSLSFLGWQRVAIPRLSRASSHGLLLLAIISS